MAERRGRARDHRPCDRLRPSSWGRRPDGQGAHMDADRAGI